MLETLLDEIGAERQFTLLFSFKISSLICVLLDMPLFSESFVFNNLGNCVAIVNHLSY
jgi:hypothetical protein